jgi:hypothetical protein
MDDVQVADLVCLFQNAFYPLATDQGLVAFQRMNAER